MEKIIKIPSSKSEEEFVESIVKQLNFPDIYGHTFYSLEEHFFYDSMLKVPDKLIIDPSFRHDLELSEKLKEVLEKHNTKNQEFNYEFR